MFVEARLRHIAIAAIIAVAALGVFGQTTPQGQEDLKRRIDEIESKLRALTDELKTLREQASTGATYRLTSTPAAAIEKKAEPVPQPAVQKKEIGIDLGSVRLTPYGTIFFNAFTNTGAVNNLDVPLFAAASGHSGSSASLRQTRLGLRLEGARAGRARLGAVVEADFFGGFPGVGVGENFGVVRLRLANVKLDWERTSLVAGQDWMPFAPLNPTSLAAAAIPQMAAAGNNWARIPQLRVDRKLGRNVTWQGAILAPQTGDSAATAGFFLQPNAGAASHSPFVQSRISFAETNFLGTKRAGSVAASVHYGRASAFVGTSSLRREVDSWGVAADWNLPFSKIVALTGEAFIGQALGGFQSGVFQTINTDFARAQGVASTADGIRAVRTRGGWMQFAVTPQGPTGKLGLYGTVGIDDPDDHFLTSVAARDWRLRNLAFAGEVIYKFTPQLQFGIEFRQFETLYRITRARTARHLNLALAYSF